MTRLLVVFSVMSAALLLSCSPDRRDRNVAVSFETPSRGHFAGTLEIRSNDVKRIQVDIPLSGETVDESGEVANIPLRTDKVTSNGFDVSWGGLRDLDEVRVLVFPEPVPPTVAPKVSWVAGSLPGNATFFRDVSADAPQAQQLIEIRTAAPSVIAVVVQGGPYGVSEQASIALDRSDWAVDGTPPDRIFRYSIPWDETKDLKVFVRHRIYLEFEDPLVSGRNYLVETPFGARVLEFDERTTYCEAIKVNQVGYNRRSTSRFANFGVFLGDGGSRFYESPPLYEVVEQRSGKVVSRGAGRYMGDDTAVADDRVTSGEHVYRLSLNDVPKGGPYYVVVMGCGRSRMFGVGDAYTREIARTSVRGLYHQRCGIALTQPYTTHTRAICHTEVADTRTPFTNNPTIKIPPNPTRFSIAGGHHDAGDFDRRPWHLRIPILMLGYYEAFPHHFVDSQYDIPESGNGVPDFLDEAMWAILLWENLQITDPADPDFGGVRMGTERLNHPAYGVVSAASEGVIYGTWKVGIESTALSAGIFAHAARLLAPYDLTHSSQLLKQAKLAWNWLLSHADVRLAETKFLYSSLQLYLATGEQSFHDLFRSSAERVVLGIGGAIWPEQYLPGNIGAKAQTAHFVSYLLNDQPADPDLAIQLRDRILDKAESGGYMGPPPETQPYPQGVSKSMGWGAATAQGRYADLYCFANRITTDPLKKQQYFDAAAQYGDFALGLNPLGISFVTGLGTDQPVSPLHLDSYYTKFGLSDGITNDHLGNPKGNVPGILVYGPSMGRRAASYQRAVSDKLYPAWEQLPQLRRWGDGWSLIPNNEFTVHETSVWNAVLHGCLYDASVEAEPQSP